MKHRNDHRDLCASTHEDDGHNPRHDRTHTPRDTSHKDLQLCKQVRRALETHLATATWAEPPGLRIENVTPDPDSTRLRISVSWANQHWTLTATLTLLVHRKPELRWAAANAITRKRAPELTFEAAPRTEDTP